VCAAAFDHRGGLEDPWDPPDLLDFAGLRMLFLPIGIDRLATCHKARSNPRSLRAKHQHSRQAATIGDAPASNDGDRTHDIDNRWNERQRASVAGMPAGLGALRGDNIDTR
jgi:hypothetical protein